MVTMQRFFRLIILSFVALSTVSCLLPRAQQYEIMAYRLPTDAARPVKIHVNQVGYMLQAPKFAVAESAEPLVEFRVFSVPQNDEVYRGELSSSSQFSEWGGGPYYAHIDFSALQEEGSFEIEIAGVRSLSFQISARQWRDDTLMSVLRFFTSSRANNSDVWNADRAVPIFGSSQTVDVRGGWYDASGDISKYFSHLSYANFFNPQQIPLTAWALSWVSQEAERRDLGKDVRDRAAAEAVWGGDFLLRMLSETGYFYSNVFDRWTGDMQERRVCTFKGKGGEMSTAYEAAFREGGGLAIAALARISTLSSSGVFSSQEYLDGARRGFAYLQQHNLRHVDDGVENIIDDYAALLAATELYRASRDESYLSYARNRANALHQRLHNDGYFIADDAIRPFWHAADAGLPLVALTLYAELESDVAARTTALQTLHAHTTYLLEMAQKTANPYGYARQHFSIGRDVFEGFFMPHENETGYWWQGENARLGSLAAGVALAAGALAADGRDLPPWEPYAWAQLNWILGANPLDICFLKGSGHHNPPKYSHAKPQHTDLPGGISNGITGSDRKGRGIDWFEMPGRQHDAWSRWRWYEQWLPHSTWFMMGLVALQPSVGEMENASVTTAAPDAEPTPAEPASDVESTPAEPASDAELQRKGEMLPEDENKVQ